MNNLRVQLYSRGVGEAFSEEVSVREEVSLSASPVTHVLTTLPTRKALEAIRLDLMDQPGRIRLHELQVRSKDGAELFHWDGGEDEFEGVSGMRLAPTRDGTLVTALDNDPHLVIRLAPEQAGRSVTVSFAASRAMFGDSDEDLAPLEALQKSHRELVDVVRRNEAMVRRTLDNIGIEQDELQRLMLSAVTGERELQRTLEATADKMASALGALESDFAPGLTELSARIDRHFEMHRRRSDDSAALDRRHLELNLGALEARLRQDIGGLLQAGDEPSGRAAELEAMFAALAAELPYAHASPAGVLNEVRRVSADAAAARREVLALVGSTSWRVTRPLRVLSRLLTTGRLRAPRPALPSA